MKYPQYIELTLNCKEVDTRLPIRIDTNNILPYGIFSKKNTNGIRVVVGNRFLGVIITCNDVKYFIPYPVYGRNNDIQFCHKKIVLEVTASTFNWFMASHKLLAVPCIPDGGMQKQNLTKKI